MKRLLLASLLAFPVYGAPWTFRGELSSVSSTGVPCDALFQQTDYEAKVFAVGANHLTAVVHFESPSGNGALHKHSLLGSHGGMGDIKVESTEVGANETHFVAEGLFDSDVLYLKISAKVKALGGGPALCSASADYTGFPR